MPLMAASRTYWFVDRRGDDVRQRRLRLGRRHGADAQRELEAHVGVGVARSFSTSPSTRGSAGMNGSLSRIAVARIFPTGSASAAIEHVGRRACDPFQRPQRVQPAERDSPSVASLLQRRDRRRSCRSTSSRWAVSRTQPLGCDRKPTSCAALALLASARAGSGPLSGTMR